MDSRQRNEEAKSARPLALRVGLLVLCLKVLLLSGCSAFLRSTPAPIPTRQTSLSAAAPSSTLVVFLPGRGGSMDDFEREGIVTILRDAGVRADTVAVDAHLGYYFDRTIIERLQNDVLIPARKRGYKRIVLVGVSLGGLGSLLNERDHPGSVDALVLLGPYLGSKTSLFEKIATAGGPQRWADKREPLSGGVEEQLWTFLGSKSSMLPPTWLLYGDADRLGTGHRLLAGLLPSDKVFIGDGGHDWPTWRALWKNACMNSALFHEEKSPASPVPNGATAPAQ